MARARLTGTANASTCSLYALHDFEALAGLLEGLAGHPRRCVVRGAVADPARVREVRRLLHPDRDTGEAPTLRDVPRRWCALDMDAVPVPASVPPENLERCARNALALLPPAWQVARCIVQATAGYARAIKGHTLAESVTFPARMWTWRRDGEVWCEAECTLTIHAGGNGGALRMRYAPPDPFDRGHGPQDWTISLVTTRPPLGGRQWWFLCPASGRRCRKLFLPAGGRRFLS